MLSLFSVAFVCLPAFAVVEKELFLRREKSSILVFFYLLCAVDTFTIICYYYFKYWATVKRSPLVSENL